MRGRTAHPCQEQAGAVWKGYRVGGGRDRRPLAARIPLTGLQSPAAQTQNPTAEWEGAVK